MCSLVKDIIKTHLSLDYLRLKTLPVMIWHTGSWGNSKILLIWLGFVCFIIDLK